MRGKYAALEAYLRSLRADTWRATFRDIEEVIDDTLPPGARSTEPEHHAWWANTDTHVQGRAWTDAGWEATEVDRVKETVVFRQRDATRRGAPRQDDSDRSAK